MEKIGFIGGGNMAEALVKGLLAGGMPATDIVVAEPADARRAFLQGQYGIKVTADNTAVAGECHVVVLAVKPQVFPAVAAALGAAVNGKLAVSIMAGIATAAIEAALGGGVRVVRVMPNTPAVSLAAASVVSGGASATADDVSLVQRLFAAVGTAHVLDEKLMDAVTGLSGSGPAYVFTFIEALSDAGVRQGLPRDVASALAAQTVLGAAKMVLETGEHPAVLKEKVTSPGGTTIAGLHVLEKGAFRAVVMDAVEGATKRSRQLGKKGSEKGKR